MQGTICTTCGQYIYQCERCGGSKIQQAGRYWQRDHYEYEPEGPCKDCESLGYYAHSESSHRSTKERRTALKKLDDALVVIRDPTSLYVDQMDATATICEQGSKDEVIECMRRGGLCAEHASIELYNRTGREPRPSSPDDFILDADNWTEYLREKNLETKKKGKH